MIYDTALFVDIAWRAGLVVDPVLTVSEWADSYRVLSSLSTEPGAWRTERTPYLRAIMDALGPDDPHETVVLMKGSQIGATDAGFELPRLRDEARRKVILLVMPNVGSRRDEA